MKIMNKNKIYKVVVRAFSYLLLLTAFLFTACADLEYTEETTRDEAWTYEYFSNGIKNLVFDVYAQVYNNEFAANSAYFLACATDEAQYALETGVINGYVNGGWSPANPFSNTWTKAYTAIADVNMYLEKIDEADIKAPGVKKSSTGKLRMEKSSTATTEINLLGMTVDEACMELDKFIDNAALAHLPSVRIVHGKGTGKLRQGVQKYLKKNKHVKSFRLGEYGEGDAGVTIAELK